MRHGQQSLSMNTNLPTVLVTEQECAGIALNNGGPVSARVNNQRRDHQTWPMKIVGGCWLTTLSLSSNDRRESHHRPSGILCVDESIFPWCGYGGEWINIGLPMSIEIERKPKNGCEVQTCCDGETGVMMRMKRVKSANAPHQLEASLWHNEDPVTNKGTKALKDLTHPWARSWHFVVADSHFASVQAALAMCAIGLFFVGVVKTAAKRFPLHHLNSQQFAKR